MGGVGAYVEFGDYDGDEDAFDGDGGWVIVMVMLFVT